MSKVELSYVLNNLEMDDSIVDTSKAEEYLAEREEFRSDSIIKEYSRQEVECDSYGNKVFCLPFDNIYELYLSGIPTINDEIKQIRSDGLRKLAMEIEKETELICQLEYLIRKIPVRETKLSIQLIVQYLNYSSENIVMREKNVILIQDKTPLLAIGCVFLSLKLYNYVYLYATTETAAICHLFTELCQKVELNFVKLVIGGSKSFLPRWEFETFTNLFHDYLPEVIGVITDKSDVDSAVDTFLNSEYHPFPLARIFVQESIYKNFKDIIAWKCKPKQNANINLKSNLTDAFKYETKTFCLDYAGNPEEIKDSKEHFIFVEAYRTTNELLSLLNKPEKRLCLSLWASDISEANEIALKADVSVIWINDYFNFNGPNDVSKVIFEKMDYDPNNKCDNTIVQLLTRQQKAWAKLSFDERCEKVFNAFELADKDYADIIKKKNISYWKYGDIISVRNNTMILAFSLPIPIVGFTWQNDQESALKDTRKLSLLWLTVAKALINGSAFAYLQWLKKTEDPAVQIINKLANCGLPVAEIRTSSIDSANSKLRVSFRCLPEIVQTKVIWTSYGTTFAN